MNIMKVEFDTLVGVICKFQEHINYNYCRGLVTASHRNNYFCVLDECCRQLVRGGGGGRVGGNNIMFNQLHDVIMGKKKSVNFPYLEITNIIIGRVATSAGFPSICDGLTMTMGINYRQLFEERLMYDIDFYNSIFNVTSFTQGEWYGDNSGVSVIEYEYGGPCVNILVGWATINFVWGNMRLLFNGYFSNDTLGLVLRTSMRGDGGIFDRKMRILDHITEKEEGWCERINFCKEYVKHFSLEFLNGDDDKIIHKLLNRQQFYNRLAKIEWNELIEEFTIYKDEPRKCLIHMHEIVTLLLMMKETTNRAEYLFTYLKMNDEDDVDGSEGGYWRNIIFNNLDYVLQSRLMKVEKVVGMKVLSFNGSSSNNLLIRQALCSGMPQYVKNMVIEKIHEMRGGGDNCKQLLYVSTLLKFPWGGGRDDKCESMTYVRCMLDKMNERFSNDIWGHEECKVKVIELMCKMLCSGESGGVIGLCGPPGVGKTKIARMLGNIMNLPFVQINLGGQNDGELLHGHGYSYNGAQPGMIVKKLIHANSDKCIFYFDELDKLCEKNGSNELSNILIHVTDRETNCEFQDRFFQGINFSLAKILFVFSYNDETKIDKILMDRIEQIVVGKYSVIDKIEIVKRHMLGELKVRVGIDRIVMMSDETIRWVVDEYTREAGVRGLYKVLEKLFMKMNVDRVYERGVYEKMKTRDGRIVVTMEYIRSKLGKGRGDVCERWIGDMCGVVNGLYVSDNIYGGVLSIQVTERVVGDHQLCITGLQQEMMKESLQCAVNVAYGLMSETRAHGFNVHIPDGSTPKNGTSAGCAFVVGIISCITNLKVYSNYAITGEIDLLGNVLKIGGVYEKLCGAKRAGITHVLIPSDNSCDVDDIIKTEKDLFSDNFNVVYISHITEALKLMVDSFEL